MGKNPAFQFYPNDWLRDTHMLSPQAKGGWINLLSMMHFNSERGKLTSDYAGLARLFGCDIDYAKTIIAELIENNICSHVTKVHGKVTLISRRMLHEEKIKESDRKRKSLQRSRKSHGKVISPSSSPKDSSSIPTTKHKEKSTKKESDFLLPDWIDKKLWKEFLQHRKKRKAPNTDRTSNAIIKNLQKMMLNGHDPNQLIELMLTRNWLTIQEDWIMVYNGKPAKGGGHWSDDPEARQRKGLD